MQQGSLTLEQAVFIQTTKLEGDKALIERAAEVCRGIEASGVEYAALEPQPWLARLQAPQRPSLTPPSRDTSRPEADSAPRACYHPWMRFFARSLDMALYDTLLNVLWLVMFRDQSFLRLQTANLLTTILTSMALLALTLALEPLWLHFWGWTPGKWVFGLKLRNEDGTRLSIAQGWERSWQLAWEGYGWNIPFYSLWRFWRCWNDAMDGWNGEWNGEVGCRYTKEERRFSGWIFAAARIALMALLLTATLWSMVPPSGTMADIPDLARNYNHCLRVLEYGGETAIPTLDEQGQWVEREQSGGGVVINLFGDTTEYEKLAYTLGGPLGGVTSVTLRMASQDKAVGGCTREYLMLLSLCRSAGELNLLNILPAQRDAAALLDRWEDFDQDFLGVHVSQRVEAVGYERTNAFGALLWCEDESIPHHCEKTVTFTVRLVDGAFSPAPGQAEQGG